jgi:BlaI family transcriptional regulator, penicillinase repressor
MARPAQELTERELDVLHLFWDHGELTAAAARDHLARAGCALSYTTVATLVRILHDKGYVRPVNHERPFRYVAVRSYEDVSARLLGRIVQRVFRGSRETLLVRLLDNGELTEAERALLQSVLQETQP